MNAYPATALSQGDPRRRHPKRRRLSPHDARKALTIIGDIQAPLPPDIPLSPPPSRSPSPLPQQAPVASSSKRRADADDQSDTLRRPKVAKQQSSASGLPPAHLPSVAPPTASHSHIPPQDSLAIASRDPRTQSNSSSAATSASASTTTTNTINSAATTAPTTPAQSSSGGPSPRSLTVHEPVRRPRHGMQSVDFKALQRKVYNQARLFKYSGDARFSSTYAPSDSNYRALKEAPPKDSPYHIHGGCMANLESLEALICFVYAAWCSDKMTGSFSTSHWTSIPDFLTWCKRKWLVYVGHRDNAREKAFLGLIMMIEAFTNARIVRRHNIMALTKMTQQYQREIDHELDMLRVKQAASEVVRPPKMQEKFLPSPDTDASATSSPANSNSIAESSRTDRERLNGKKARELTSSDVNIPVSGSYVDAAKRLISIENAAGQNMHAAEKTLSLAIMREHFPHTFGRMVCSTLSAEEEYEPDMEDNEGELFWPSQCVTGEGVAWVCLMGRAMVREYGKDLGYRGFEALIPKPGGSTGTATANTAAPPTRS